MTNILTRRFTIHNTNLKPFKINSTESAPNMIPNSFCRIKIIECPNFFEINLENKKNIEVIKVTIISGIKLVKIFIIEKVNFSEINIASVMADGPIIRGIATGKIRKLNRN